MDRKVAVAVVGATGLVGEAMIRLLEERAFPFTKLHLIASKNSAGRQIRCRGRQHTVADLADFDFSDVDIAFFSAGADVSREHATRAAYQGAVVIDNTSCFRYEEDVPLVVPEVNPEAIADYRQRGIIANPNCSTIQMTVALNPIYRAVGIERINCVTYQAVSGAGRGLVEDLARQTAQLLNGKPVEVAGNTKQIAFNVIPHIDEFQENGYTREEMKIAWETQKIFSDPELLLNATAVRVPVFFGHSEAVHLETREPLTADYARELLAEAPGIQVFDQLEAGGYPTAVPDAADQDSVFVGRIREDISHPRGLNLWIVADNIRKGAATNSLQIAEIFVKSYL
ncbi:MAG: aspartate-semialdehyde dehydrogenase [Gammaproteobacteria bacterium]